MNKFCAVKYNLLFQKAMSIVLQFEGGYVNHPNDPGGATNKGVTQKVYDTYRKSKNLSIQSVKYITDDELYDIYYNDYWLRASCDKIFARLAILHFDTSVNCGVTQSNKFLQRTIDVIADGIVGPVTLKKLKEFNGSVEFDEIINKYITHRLNYYNLIAERNEKLKVFLKGWNNRVAILKESLSNIGGIL